MVERLSSVSEHEHEHTSHEPRAWSRLRQQLRGCCCDRLQCTYILFNCTCMRKNHFRVIHSLYATYICHCRRTPFQLKTIFSVLRVTFDSCFSNAFFSCFLSFLFFFSQLDYDLDDVRRCVVCKHFVWSRTFEEAPLPPLFRCNEFATGESNSICLFIWRGKNNTGQATNTTVMHFKIKGLLYDICYKIITLWNM